MRLSTPLKTTLSAAAALALLTACGGGSDDEASATSSSSSAATSSDAAEPSADLDADEAAFCADAQDAISSIEETGNTTDVNAIPQLLADASTRLDAIEPPAEISEAWGNFTGALDTAVSAIQGVDLSTPEGQQTFSTALTTLQSTATEDQAAVQSYLVDTCGISPETAAPTS